jgi:hypothetical protein
VHAVLGEEGRPEARLEHFVRLMDGGLAGRVDVALFHFGPADFAPGVDGAALFARYQAALAGLRARHPRTRFVHVTAPLTCVQGGARGFVRHLLDRPAAGEEENVRREGFNARLREAYGAGGTGGEPLFDLAALQAAPPGAPPTTFLMHPGRTFLALAPALSSDGTHLNAEGRRHVASHLVALLASLPPPTPEAPPAPRGEALQAAPTPP